MLPSGLSIRTGSDRETEGVIVTSSTGLLHRQQVAKFIANDSLFGHPIGASVAHEAHEMHKQSSRQADAGQMGRSSTTKIK